MKRYTLLFVLLAVVAVACPALAQPQPAKVKILGYFQNRYQQRSWTMDEFILRCMYITLLADVNERTKANVTWARIGPTSTDANWAMAYVDYKVTPEWTARFGQAPTWFGLETAQGSSQRLALERAAVLEGGNAAGGLPSGLFAFGPWDRGVWAIRSPKKAEPQVIVGILNGQFRNVEADNAKNISVDVKFTKPWGLFGASWLKGKWTNDIGLPAPPAGTATDRNATLGYVRWAPKGQPVAVQTEYATGSLLGNDIKGWYIQLEHPLAQPGTVAFLKYENYDPNTGVTGNSYTGLHVGYVKNLDSANKLTLQYDNGKNNGVAAPGDKSRNGIGFQWQCAFSQ